MTKKLLLFNNGFSELREYKLDPDKPRSDDRDGVQFNLGKKWWLFGSYDVKTVILKQTDENKYKTADSPVSNDNYYVIEIFKSHENDGSLIIDDGKLAKYIGKTHDELIKEIDTLMEEMKKKDLKYIEDKKRIVEFLEKVQNALAKHEIAYGEKIIINFEKFIDKITDELPSESSESDGSNDKVGTFIKKERARITNKEVPQLPESVTQEEPITEGNHNEHS